MTVSETDRAAIVPGHIRYSVSFSKRDWPFRPWRWKRVHETRYMQVSSKEATR